MAACNDVHRSTYNVVLLNFVHPTLLKIIILDCNVKDTTKKILNLAAEGATQEFKGFSYKLVKYLLR